MRKYRNILVIVESQMNQQIALQRALEIAKFSPDTKITAFLAIYDFSYDLTSVLSLEDQVNMKNGIVQANEKWLEDELCKYKGEYPLINSKVVWQRNIAESILQEIQRDDYDLILKSSEEHGFLDTVLFTPLDWQLLRSSSIPVLLAKEHCWDKGAVILVALNFADNNDKHQRLMNIRLLRNAQELATLIDGNIHLINAAPPVIPAAVVEIPGFSPDIYSEALLKHNKEQIELFANRHRIPTKNCHVKEGQPDDVIPELAAELNACAVLIGNEGRSGISGAIIGNTCEQIVDDLNCDLLVIKSNDS
jgi:universal stress protein E